MYVIGPPILQANGQLTFCPRRGLRFGSDWKALSRGRRGWSRRVERRQSKPRPITRPYKRIGFRPSMLVAEMRSSYSHLPLESGKSCQPQRRHSCGPTFKTGPVCCPGNDACQYLPKEQAQIVRATQWRAPTRFAPPQSSLGSRQVGKLRNRAETPVQAILPSPQRWVRPAPPRGTPGDNRIPENTMPGGPSLFGSGPSPGYWAFHDWVFLHDGQYADHY